MVDIFSGDVSEKTNNSFCCCRKRNENIGTNDINAKLLYNPTYKPPSPFEYLNCKNEFRI